MDCDKAGDAMMQYMEKKIKPGDAAALTRHLLKCEDCREYFIALDEAHDAMDITPAPEGFTAAVMAKVAKLPAYVPVQPAAAVPGRADVAIRIFGGLCTVVLGIAAGLTWYPEAAARLFAAFPSLTVLADAFAQANGFFGELADQLMQAGNQVSALTTNSFSGYFPLFLVFILATALMAMLRGERGENSKA